MKYIAASLIVMGLATFAMSESSDDGCLEVVPDCPGGNEMNFGNFGTQFGAPAAPAKNAPAKASAKPTAEEKKATSDSSTVKAGSADGKKSGKTESSKNK